MSNNDQLEKIKNAPGFIAALDQSGGSTPKALGLYGVTPDAWSNEEEMYTVVHEMRTRIMTSPAFGGDRILGAILFENTMDREVEGQSTASYLWNVKNVVPFLKVDKGLADEENGAQVMKPMPELDALCERAVNAGVFGAIEMGTTPYPMLPYQGLLHTALGDNLADFLQGKESAEQALADVEAAYTAAAKEKGFLN